MYNRNHSNSSYKAKVSNKRSISPLNIKIDLSTNMNKNDNLHTSTVDIGKREKVPLNKEENIKVFIRLKPKPEK